MQWKLQQICLEKKEYKKWKLDTVKKYNTKKISWSFKIMNLSSTKTINLSRLDAKWLGWLFSLLIQ